MISAIELMRKLGMKVPEEESEDKDYTLLLREITDAVNNTDKLPFKYAISDEFRKYIYVILNMN